MTDTAAATTPPVIESTAHDATRSRRSLLRLAGVAATAGAAATLLPEPAAAAAATWQIGSESNTTNTLTKSTYTGASGGGSVPDGNCAFEFHSGAGSTSFVGGTEAVVAAVAGTDSLLPNALLAVSRRLFGTAVIAAATEEGSVGLQAESAGTGGVGVVAIATTGIGAIIRGGTSHLRMPSLTGLRPAATAGGELLHDSIGQLWFNAQPTGSLATNWRLLASTVAAGSFTPISPTRVYDSRRGTAPIGKLLAGQSRTLSARQTRDVNTGIVQQGVTLFDFAVAVAITVTVVSTTGQGWLTLNTGGNTTVGGSSINWSANNQVLANSTTTPVDYIGNMTVVCGGNAAAGTHFLLDVIGIYR